MTQASDDFAAEFWPQQVSVGIKGGIELMTGAARLVMERRPDFIFAKLDFKNAHNRFSSHRRPGSLGFGLVF